MDNNEGKVQGRSYTSNIAKLLKQMPKLIDLQEGKRPSPVMVHMSLCNPCNLTCSFCCFANRKMKDILPIEKVKQALDSFRYLGATGVEFSVSKDEVVPYFVDGQLRVDTIDKVVENKVGQSLSISDSGEHLQENILHFVKHEQQEPLMKITLQTGRHIKVTKSHSIFFYENDKIIYKPVSKAKEGDLVVVSTKAVRPEKEIKMSAEYARLLGYFVSEGSFSFQRERVPHGVQFSFDAYEQEKKYIDDVCSIIEGLGYNYGVAKTHNKTVVYSASKKFFAELRVLDMGDKSQTRRVPNCIFNCSRENQIEFLKGLFSGDGCFRNTPYKKGDVVFHRNSLHLKTSSEILQKTVGFLLQQLSINSSFEQGINRKRFIEGRELGESVYYVVSINGLDNLTPLESIIKFMGKSFKFKESIYSSRGSRFKPVTISENVIALPIKKIDKAAKEDFVYDLSVGDTHRFVSSFGILCHNTGGGESTLHPQFDEIATYAHSLGFKLGLCTNGTRLDKISVWDKFTWVRLGMYGFDEGYEYKLDVFKGLDVDISGAYVCDFNLETSTNPNITGEWTDTKAKKLSTNTQKIENFYKMLEFVEANKIPTRIAFNAIKDTKIVQKDIDTIRELMKDRDLKYAFLSDFNYKGERRNDNCYMHMIKPFVFTDGNVYVCPSSELSPENLYNMNDQFKLCDIDGIIEFYEKGPTTRKHACAFCKYALQNELIDDILTETKHNDFA